MQTCHSSKNLAGRVNGKSIYYLGTSLTVQWLRLRASNEGGTGLIPGGGTKIPHATVQPKKKVYLLLETAGLINLFLALIVLTIIVLKKQFTF